MVIEDKTKNHVFISYIQENSDKVLKLYNQLTKSGVRVWLDKYDISPGKEWKIAIRDAIKKGAFFLACFSKEYNEKVETHMNEELVLAIDRLRKLQNNRSWFIPILLNECNIPDIDIGGGKTLADIQWVNLDDNWNKGFAQILQVLKPTPKKIQLIEELLNHEDPEMHRVALNYLGEDQNTESIAALVKALIGKEQSIRKAAAEKLKYVKDNLSIQEYFDSLGDNKIITTRKLIELIRNPDEMVRTQSALLLGCTKSEEVIDHLVVALGDKRTSVYVQASKSLIRIGGDATVKALISAIELSSSTLIRVKSAYILGIIKSIKAVPALLKALSDEELAVSNASYFALKNIGGHDSEKAIMEYRQMHLFLD